MNQDNTVNFALAFPQGHIIFLQKGGTYFLPLGTMDAFQVYGEGKELFGKKALTVRGDRETDAPDYSVVYEFNDAQNLTDARLVTREQTMRGTLADADFIDTLNGALAQNALKLYTTRDTQPEQVSKAYRFADGRYLIQMCDPDDLYLGTPDNYQKLGARCYIQGGNSKYYRDTDGGEITLHGQGGEMSMFKGEFLNALHLQQNGNPAEFGLSLTDKQGHLSPFHPLVLKDRGIQPAPPAPGR